MESIAVLFRVDSRTYSRSAPTGNEQAKVENRMGISAGNHKQNNGIGRRVSEELTVITVRDEIV